MDAGASRRRPRSSVEDEAEADAARYNSETSPTSVSSKRLRLRGGGSDSQEEEEDEDEDEEDQDDTAFYSMHDNGEGAADRDSGRPLTNGTSSLRFQPGAIVRVRVDNFVTYAHAEFFPGPNLNMVIGPNGTGKSSLVCAICLGLGYQPNVLGRASKVGDFVKHGKDSAIVEVELQKRPKDPENFVVRLRITREDHGRKFWLNGKEMAWKNIQKVMRTLRIQIDNLCQFLPQDKVAEFAGLSSVELLTKTLQAAASPEMIEWQNELKEIYSGQKEAKLQIAASVEQLRSMEGRQQALQADVDRLREREEIEQLISDLQSASSMAVYSEARAKHTEAKELKKSAAAKLKKLEDTCGPSLEAVNRKQGYQRQLEDALQDRKRMLKAAEDAADRTVADVGNMDTQIKELEDRKDVARQGIQDKKKELGTIRQKITSLEAQLKRDHKEFKAAEWNVKIREKEHRQREIEGERRENNAERTRIKALGSDVAKKKREAQAELTALDSRQGQQLNALKRIAPNVADGLKWLEDNRDKFDKEIFGPPMISCSVKDKKYSNQIQALLQSDDFLCFTTQTKEDHKKLSDQFYREMHLSVTIRTNTTKFANYKPPMSSAELHELGLDCFAIDCLEGPEPVLAMLCAERRLHLSAVARVDISEEQYQRVVDGEKISTWAAGSQNYRIIRRKEYGAGATSTTSRNIPQGRYWSDQPVDDAEKREIRQRLDEFEGQVNELLEDLNQLKEKGTELDEQGREIDNEIAELRKAKNQLQAEHQKWLSLPLKIEQGKKTLKQRQEDHAEARQQLYSLDDKIDKLTLERARAVLRHTEQLSVIHDAYQAVIDVQVRVIEAKSDVGGLKAKNADISRMLEEEKSVLERVSAELGRLKDVASQALVAVRTTLAGVSDDKRAYLEQLARDKTVEEINNEVAAERSKLEFTHGVNPGAIREYNTRAKEIERLRKQRAAQENEMEQTDNRIKAIRDRWEPQLDELVSKINDAFSYNFAQINCAGEVGVHKDDEFDKWAVDIKVKFRENETLQRLDQHRQSGGERAVSTIFYLMSLQSMAQAPFRVVDEINQGMDPRNERMVHERMVEIACNEHTSQYFLITPKLLSGLRYDERMRVLCIASGEHMPSEGKRLDFARCIKIQKQLVSAASA